MWFFSLIQMVFITYLLFNEHIVICYTWFVILRLLHIFCHHSRVCILITDSCRAGNDTGNVIFIHFYKWYLSLLCCSIQHIVTCYTWYVILIPLCIFCHHSRVCILITDLSRTVNVTGNFIFFTYTNGICHVFVVLVNILQLVIHDLLSSYPCASFFTIPVSVSQLQTSVEREMTREIWLLLTFTNGIYHLFIILTNILSHVIHDMLSSYSCASFVTMPVSVS